MAVVEERGTYSYAIDWLNILGYKPDTRMSTIISSYWGWYIADNDWYQYTERRNTNYFKQTRETLKPASLVAEAWSDLLMNEKLAITSDDNGIQEVLEAHFGDFGVAQADFITQAFALGTGAWAISVYGLANDGMMHPDANIVIDSYDAHQILPLTWSANGCTQCAFVTRVEFDGRDYDQCQAHVIIDGTYHILTQLFDIKSHRPVYPEGLLTDLDTRSKCQTFALVRPAVPNTHFSYCAHGASVYDNAISGIKATDEALTSFLVHLRVCRPKLFVSDTMIKKDTRKDANGNTVTTFSAFGEADDIVFRVSPADEGSDPMRVIQPDMRIDENEKAINAGLNMLSLRCGLGEQYFSWDEKTGLKTATEVVSDSSMLARTLRKHQNALTKSITVLVRGVAGVCHSLCNTALNINAAIAIDFDDSVIVDTQTERTMALNEISMLGGAPILKRKYVTTYLGFTDEEALEAFPDESAAIDEGF